LIADRSVTDDKQNQAQIGEIEFTTHYISVELSSIERAVYTELLNTLAANNFTLKSKNAFWGNDKIQRIGQLLGDCSNAGEALVRSASYFVKSNPSNNTNDGIDEDATEVCTAILEERSDEYGEFLQAFDTRLKQAEWVFRNSDGMPCAEYIQWKEDVTKNLDDDHILTTELTKMIDALQTIDLDDSQCSSFFNLQKDLDAIIKKGVSGRKELKQKVANGLPTLADIGHPREHQLRDFVDDLEKFYAEAVSRYRSLRLLKQAQLIQQDASLGAESSISCDSCPQRNIPLNDLRILSFCGHIICNTCFPNNKEDEGGCPSTECGASYASSQIIRASDFRHMDSGNDSGEYLGAKLKKLIKFLQKLPKDQQVLLFTQYSKFSFEIHDILEEAGIKIVSLAKDRLSKGESPADILMKFQDDDSPTKSQVLLLNIGDESAAGR